MRSSLKYLAQLAGLAFIAVFFAHNIAEAAPRQTIGVAPFSTTADEEYHWVGDALARALALRVHHQNDLNALSIRQVRSAMKHDNIEGSSLGDPKVASKLGRQLGADIFFVGMYEAKWPSIRLMIQAISPKKQKVIYSGEVEGQLCDLVGIEAALAEEFAKALGAKKPNVIRGAFGTENLEAWHNLTIAYQTLDWQSLSARSADPKIPLSLPETAVQDIAKHIELAIKLDNDYGDAWAAMGITQALLGDVRGAKRALKQATRLGAGHFPAATLGASFLEMRQAKFGKAAAILQNAIKRHPGFLHARGYLAELYNHTHEYKKALAVWREYAKAVPKQPWVKAQLGYTKSKLGDHIGAISATIAAVDILPESPTLLLELAGRYIDANKLIGAEDALSHALKKFPKEPRVYTRLGYVYLLQGKDDLVIPISHKALLLTEFGDHRRDRAYAHLNLAKAYGHKGENAKALDHLRQAKAHGITSFKSLETDDKLKTLRALPAYKTLIGS